MGVGGGGGEQKHVCIQNVILPRMCSYLCALSLGGECFCMIPEMPDCK